MFGRNHTKDCQILLIWIISLMKKILKRLLKPVISLLELRYVSLINNGEK